MRQLATPLLFATSLLWGTSYDVYAKDIGWLAFGDLRGHFEPCGCDPKTDMGGIRRIVSVVTRERMLHPDLLLFDLGNNFNFKRPHLKNSLNDIDDLKAPFIREGLEQLNATARLYNLAEQQINSPPDLFLLTNNTAFPKTQRLIVGPSYVVFGIVEQLPLNDTFSFIKIHIRKHSTKKSILLYSGRADLLAKIMKRFYFDYVLTSNQSSWETQPNKHEKENPNLLRQSVVGRIIYSVPLGGQGLLRGGAIEYRQAPTLMQALDKSITRNPFSPSLQFPFTWLTPDVDNEDLLKDMISRYRRAQSDQFAATAQARLADLKNSQFVSATACKSCHPQAYTAWENSSHAKALDTLKAKKSDQSGECVSCHVVGYYEKGGFVDEKASLFLAGVQCENCHGPRKNHVQNPSVKPASKPKEVCISCHHPPHSSSFDFDKYWSKIKHAKD